MKFTITKIALLSFVFMTAACSDKNAEIEKLHEQQKAQLEKIQKEQKAELERMQQGQKAPLSQFKATTPRDKSTYKNPTF